MILVRKVELSVWDPIPEGFAAEEVPAGVLWKGTDLRAADNELSFWRFDASDPRWKANAILAIAGGWKALNDNLHFAWVDEDPVTRDGVVLRPSSGNTIFGDLKDYHVDAVMLDLTRLATIARHLARGIRNAEQFDTATRQEILDHLADAVAAGRIRPDNMPQKLREPVLAELERRSNR